MKVFKVILWIFFFPVIMWWYIFKGLFWLVVVAATFLTGFFKEALKPSSLYSYGRYGRNTRHRRRRYY